MLQLLALAPLTAPAASTASICPPPDVVARTRIHSPRAKAMELSAAERGDPYDCLSHHFWHISMHFTNRLRGEQTEGQRGYGTNESAIKQEIAACKERLLAAGVKGETLRESCQSNSGGATFAANREFYEHHLLRLAWRPIAFLQVGVFRGESMAVWSEWLRRARLTGLDVNLGPAEAHRPTLVAKGAFQNDNVRLLETDTTDEAKFAATTRAHPDVFAGGFDVIVDDGCHTTECIVATYEQLYDRLKPGGLYFVEDNLHACGILRSKRDWAYASFKGGQVEDELRTPGSTHPTMLCVFKKKHSEVDWKTRAARPHRDKSQ